MELQQNYSANLLPDPCNQDIQYTPDCYQRSEDKIEPLDWVGFGAAFLPAFLPFIKLHNIQDY
jgi:hypothetical protein